MPRNKLPLAMLLPALLLLVAVAAGADEQTLLPAPAGMPELGPEVTPAKIELGKQLFFDRRLSGDGTMSCATCHIPELAFTDGQAIALSYPTTENWRNTPTLVNLAYNRSLFLDGRAATIEEQALFPILSAFEMNQNLDFLEEELRAVPEYVEAFTRAFGDGDTNRRRIAGALAAFERTLVSKNAPLDRFLAGDGQALSPRARLGYQLFTGKGRCVSCHYGVNLIDNGFHALNVPEHPDFQQDPGVAATRRFVAKFNGYRGYATLAEDPGRYLITKERKDWRAFKTPTLREISRTGPYMHNGIFETLAQVVDFFDQGGGPGNTALTPLGLSGEEKMVLTTFLAEALAGEQLFFSHPQLP